MAEYIEREEAIAWFMPYVHAGESIEADVVISDLKGMKAADVEPVVRCRECVHWKPTGSKDGNSFLDMEYIGGCEFTNYCRRESDFCSYGERKDGDGNG